MDSTDDRLHDFTWHTVSLVEKIVVQSDLSLSPVQLTYLGVVA